MGGIKEVNMVAVLSTIILVATVITIIFAFTAYMISIARRKKSSAQKQERKDQATKNIKPPNSRILKPYNPFGDLK